MGILVKRGGTYMFKTLMTKSVKPVISFNFMMPVAKQSHGLHLLPRVSLFTASKNIPVGKTNGNKADIFISTLNSQKGASMFSGQRLTTEEHKEQAEVHELPDASPQGYLSLAEFHELQNTSAQNPLTILDVRSPEQFRARHIRGAINIPLEDLLKGKNLPKAPDNTTVVTVCNRGADMAKEAVAHLRQLGWVNATILSGGMSTWVTPLNQMLKAGEFEQVKRLLKSPQFCSVGIDSRTLNIALLTGEVDIIFDLIEKGARPNADSHLCAAISAPIFTTIILNMVKAKGRDLKAQLSAQYGPINTENAQSMMVVPQEIAQRIRLLEVSEFWKSVWVSRQSRGENPNFHNYQVKPYLAEYLSRFPKETVNTILVPFCGKSVDMLWLQEQGYHVIGVDLSDEATDVFFAQHGLSGEKTQEADFLVKKANTSTGSLTILCGDIFKLQPRHLENVHLVYDRAGYNSIPLELRQQYAKLLSTHLQQGTKVLVSVLDFEGQRPKSGPPYFISNEELFANFRGDLEITLHPESPQDYFPSPPANDNAGKSLFLSVSGSRFTPTTTKPVEVEEEPEQEQQDAAEIACGQQGGKKMGCG